MNTRLETSRDRSCWRLLPFVFVLLAALVALGAADAPTGRAAQAVVVSCGQTLRENTMVSNNLTNCPGDGLVIGSAGITVNLNGHTIDGQSSGFGIRNDSFANVTIRNGQIAEFNRGLMLAGSSNRVQGVRVFQSVSGGILASGRSASITGSVVADNRSFGIRLQGAGSRVANSVSNNNGSVGIVIDGRDATVNGNRTLSNGFAGIVASASADNAQLTGNIVNANDITGIVVNTPSAKLTRNTASFNQSLGIDAQSGAVTDGGGNKAVDNGGGAGHQCENVVCTSS